MIYFKFFLTCGDILYSSLAANLCRVKNVAGQLEALISKAKMKEVVFLFMARKLTHDSNN